MTMDLVCGAIGVSATQREAIELAARHGFESVEAHGDYLDDVEPGTDGGFESGNAGQKN